MLQKLKYDMPQKCLTFLGHIFDVTRCFSIKSIGSKLDTSHGKTPK